MKSDFNVTIPWKNVYYDARGYTWKVGRIAPREDGLHGETQISDETLDKNLAKRLFLEGINYLLEQFKDYAPNAWFYNGQADTSHRALPENPSDTDSAETSPYQLFDDYFSVNINLAGVHDRSEATTSQISALGISYVTNYVVAGWYKLVDPSREDDWLNRIKMLETRLSSALRFKKEPEEP